MEKTPQAPSADEVVTMYIEVVLGRKQEDSETAQRSPEHLAAWRELKGQVHEALEEGVTMFDIPD